jgi:hypothetical protein
MQLSGWPRGDQSISATVSQLSLHIPTSTSPLWPALEIWRLHTMQERAENHALAHGILVEAKVIDAGDLLR